MYKISKIDWDPKKKGIRDDLKLAPFALELGYTLSTNHSYIDGIPHDPIHFSKGNIVIWEAIIKDECKWRACDYINEKACNHRTYDNLLTALEWEHYRKP